MTSDSQRAPASSSAILAELREAHGRITEQLSHVIVGQEEVVEELLISVLAGGHCLLVGVPGLAKTLMVRSLAKALGLSFNRVQFTPDLMPADITGTEVIQEDRSTGARTFRFVEGPIFANVVLADEINRTPPKTQAALLEAMQEHQVTAGGQRHPLPEPFFVLATQNPIEQEGTFPLPEAQRDRFLLEVHVSYPDEASEFEIVRRTTGRLTNTVQAVLDAEKLRSLQNLVRDIPVADHVIRYAMAFSRLTRKEEGDVPEFVQEYVTWGAGPRATQSLVLAAKARAALHGRDCVGLEDVKLLAPAVLRHRLILNFAADADGVTPDEITRRLAEQIPPETDAIDFINQVSTVTRSS